MLFKTHAAFQERLEYTKAPDGAWTAEFSGRIHVRVGASSLERCRHRLAKHPVEVNMPDELVLLQIDPVLMERALGQILDNAAKYSPEGSMIDVQGRRETDSFVLTVTDRGAGLDPSDRSLLGQKFFRGKRHAQST